MSEIKTFQSKPKTVKAIQFVTPSISVKEQGETVVRLVTAKDVIHPPIFFGEEPWRLRIKADYSGVHLILPPGEGWKRINPGDYLIIHDSGKREAMEASAFNAQFEEVEPGTPTIETLKADLQSCQRSNRELVDEIYELKARGKCDGPATGEKASDHQPSENSGRGSNPDAHAEDTSGAGAGSENPPPSPAHAEHVSSDSGRPQTGETRPRTRRRV